MSSTRESRADISARIKAEGPVRLDHACHLIHADTPKGHVSPATLLRWIVSGKRGTKLEAARIKGEWHTSLAAIQRFGRAAGV